jgi:predicted permease
MRPEHWLYTIPLRLRSLFRWAQADRELDDELRDHLERKTEEYVAQGMTPEVARRRARLDLGGIEQTKEKCRDARRVNYVENLIQDLRYALRMLVRNPGFTGVAVLTLGLGIGANTAIFSVINGVLLRPLPYAQPNRLFFVFESNPEAHFTTFPMSTGDFLDHRSQDTLVSLAAYTRSDLQLAANDRPERLIGMRVSAGFFHVLGFAPQIGREFIEREEMKGNDREVVLSHSLWERRFGADPQIVGQTVTLSGQPFTIVGVMPAGLQHVGGGYHALPHGENVDIWWPTTLDPQQRGTHYHNIIGRLAASATIEQANTQMNATAERLAQLYPDADRGWHVKLEPLREEIVGHVRPVLFVLLGAAGFVLLIACVNVANLLLARAAARQRELAVRVALGANRRRLVGQMLTESVAVALAGGLIGIALAAWGVAVLRRLDPVSLPRTDAITVDRAVYLFTFLLTLATVVLFGLIPALQASKSDVNDAFKESGRSTSAGMRHERLRRSLVVAEIGLSFLLLVGAGLLMRTLVRLQRMDPGFRPDHVLTFGLSLPQALYDQQRAAQFYEQLDTNLSRLPGVTAVGANTDLPWTGSDENAEFMIEGRPQENDNETHARYHGVTPGYFRAIGVPLIAGRFFRDADKNDTPNVLLINQAMAERFWPGQSAVGKRVTWSDHPKDRDWFTIVGVVGNVKDTPMSLAAEPAFYWAVSQMPGITQQGEGMSVAIKSTQSPSALVGSVRRVIAQLDPNLPMAEVRPLNQIASSAVAGNRLTLQLVGLFAVLASMLAAVGIYGVISYTMQQRVHEIGIRMAIGARQQQILRLVMGDASRMAAYGVLIGAVSGLMLTRLLTSLLYGVAPNDPATFVAVAVMSSGVALLSSYLPARRATRVDPMIALRYE